MAPSEMLQPEANMFSGSVNPSFLHSEFKAAGHDFFSPTFNVHFSAPHPGPSTLSPGEHHTEDSRAADSQTQGHVPSQSSVAGSRTPSNPGLKGVRRLLSLLSPRRPQSLPSSRSNLPCGTATEPSPYNSDTPPLTPDLSSCASSPFSSQEDVTLSSVEDLGPRIPESQYLTTPEVYVRSMLKSGKGLACWRPSPRGPKSNQRGTLPGDVGTFSAEGGFKKIFNVFDDEEAIQSGASAFGGISLPSRSIVIEPNEIPQGRTIAEGASSKTMYYQSDTRNIASFEFHCRSDSGAILAATSSAQLEELEDHTDLREWIIQHAELIYKHASAIRRIAGHEALYIVTGCIKSDSWALASFKERSDPYEPMRLENTTRPSDDHCHYDWTQTWSSSEARFGSSDQAGLKDQTLFLRGFKLDFSASFRMRMGGRHPPKGGFPGNGGSASQDPSDSASGNKESPGRRGSGRGGGSGGQSGSRESGLPSLGYSSTTTASRSYLYHDAPQRFQSFGTRQNVRSIPYFPRDTCHPSDTINHYLLSTAGADFALCHDDEWRFSFQSSDHPSGFISPNIRKLNFDIKHGVAQLSNRDPCDGNLGGQSHDFSLASSTSNVAAPPCPTPTPLHQNDSSILTESHLRNLNDAPSQPQPSLHSRLPLCAQEHDLEAKLRQPLSTCATNSTMESESQKMLTLLAKEWPEEGSSAEQTDLTVLTELEDGSPCCSIQCGTDLELEAGSTSLRIPDDGRSEPPRIERIAVLRSFAQEMQYLCGNAVPHRYIQTANMRIDSTSKQVTFLCDSQPDLETWSKLSAIAECFPSVLDQLYKLGGAMSIPRISNNIGNPHAFPVVVVDGFDEAISAENQVRQPQQKAHPGHETFRDSFRECFERTGDPGDINQAILERQASVYLTPEGHPDLARRLQHLSNLLLLRFQRTGELFDINQAISAMQKAVNLTPEGDPNLPLMLSNLDRAVWIRFVGDVESERQAADEGEAEVEASPGQLPWFAPDMTSPQMLHHASDDQRECGGLVLLLLDIGTSATGERASRRKRGVLRRLISAAVAEHT